jgi:hypothetical protein
MITEDRCRWIVVDRKKTCIRHKQNHDGGELRNLKKQRAPANAAANTDRNTWITIKGKTMIVGKGEGGGGVN